MPFNFKISCLCISVIFDRGCLSPRGVDLKCLSLECLKFSFGVTYSKLFSLGFFLSKSIWLTCKSLGPTKANITSLCSLNIFCLLSLLKETYGYFILFILGRIIYPLGDLLRLWKDLTLPRSLTSYRPSYPGTGFHFSILVAFTTILTSCASVEIPDFKAHVTLPASGKGYYVKTVSDEKGVIPKEEWDVMKKRGIVLLSEDWAVLRYTILKNCLTMKCKQAVGTFDELFYTIDDALKKVGKAK